MYRVSMVPAASILVIIAITGVLSEQCCMKVNNSTKQMIDPSGRSRLFHGVNVVYKVFPYHPKLNMFDPFDSLSHEDMQLLQDSGLNVVRLYVAWPGVEPTRGEYNMTYLQVIEDIVNNLGKLGIYTILDCHQDLWSPKFCGEGAPDFAALYTDRTIKPLPFPEPYPSLHAYPVDNTTGYPSREDCSKHSFFQYYFCDAEGKTWQSLYDNEQHVQEYFALFWQQIAKKFSLNPYVLGYELVNEPWAGDVYRHPDQLEPHIADKVNLSPMYTRLHQAIREVDNSHVPFNGFANTGLTEGPGGSLYNDRQVLAYHLYCVLLDKNGEPFNARLCQGLEKETLKIREEDGKKLGVATFMTEWGAYDDTPPHSKELSDGEHITGLADDLLQSWIYWQFKGYHDITTQSSVAEGLWFSNGTLNNDKLKMLSRTYAQAVAGVYDGQSFNPLNSDFALGYYADINIDQPTVIYLNEKFYYPNGYRVTMTPARSGKIVKSANKVTLQHTKYTKQNERITVEIKAY
ncbi:endoglycoceramidase-like isoform X2 [Dysidea avara]|uniref:endoglycoceramidase-like isoform X2 n=1 Tax=Dysidea avara TaxID=196820 RepID=UPI00331BB6C4